MIEFSKPEIELTEKDLKEIQSIVKSGRFCKGQYVEALEKHFKDECGVLYAKACCNATNGLIIAFKAANIINMNVAIPAFTWPSTLYAIECNNNFPVWCDIEPDTWNISSKGTVISGEMGLNKYCRDFMNNICPTDNKIQAIIPVDIFGNISYIDSKNSIPVIYDAAHSYGNKFLGNRGLVEVVSLSFTKPVTSMQGGIILTDNRKVYDRIDELVNLSAKMCEVNAFMALKDIERYPEKNNKKLVIIDMYREYIKVPFIEQEIKYCTNYSTYSILFESNEKRNKVVNEFKDNCVEVKTYYEPLVSGLKNTDDIYSRVLSLPTYSSIEKHVKFICDLINKA